LNVSPRNSKALRVNSIKSTGVIKEMEDEDSDGDDDDNKLKGEIENYF
jgi:hypothetical protein